MAIPMLKIRRPLGRLIFNMGIATPGKTVFLIETAPWSIEDLNLVTTVDILAPNSAKTSAGIVLTVFCQVSLEFNDSMTVLGTGDIIHNSRPNPAKSRGTSSI